MFFGTHSSIAIVLWNGWPLELRLMEASIKFNGELEKYLNKLNSPVNIEPS